MPDQNATAPHDCAQDRRSQYPAVNRNIAASELLAKSEIEILNVVRIELELRCTRTARIFHTSSVAADHTRDRRANPKTPRDRTIISGINREIRYQRFGKIRELLVFMIDLISRQPFIDCQLRSRTDRVAVAAMMRSWKPSPVIRVERDHFDSVLLPRGVACCKKLQQILADWPDRMLRTRRVSGSMTICPMLIFGTASRSWDRCITRTGYGSSRATPRQRYREHHSTLPRTPHISVFDRSNN